MRQKALQLTLWTVGISIFTASCLASDAQPVLALSVVANSWPWMALAGILMLLAVIAYAARRKLPYGRHL